MTSTDIGIDPGELETCLRVLETAENLPPDHPDAVTIRRAVGGLFKAYKQARRIERREAVSTADRAVVAATATGSPNRIDDETQGIPLVSSAPGALAGTFLRARPCYICKTEYTEVDAFYHQLCPSCAALSHEKRTQRTDLTGRRALLTGGRAKIGMYIALRLLRDGADLTITTRFPNDAARRFAALEDSADWLHRLRIVGIDLRDPAQVVALTDTVAAAGPLDILINNAAQTVRRTPGAYAPLAAAEQEPLPDGPLPEILTFDHVSDAHPVALAGSLAEHPVPHLPTALRGGELSRLALVAGSALSQHGDAAIDAGGLVPDRLTINSWTQYVQHVDPLEMLEVQLCNTT
ncbi:MAG TPA: SDR family NAD(P)-dependent oxidoreductase, partial [Jatrophihabitantaceae bacterium]|nr:SDR family NAD(P)-dependent oxidoreductase [Jatrophihabitantaceae bacterium]